MAKNKKRRSRRRRKSEAARLAAEYAERGLQREVENAFQYQECKLEHSKHVEQVKKREQEILSRTIFVTNVKDLRIRGNLEALRAFFARNYGEVEQCLLAHYSGKTRGRGSMFPKARVRFMHERDARSIFGGRKLNLVDSPVDIHSPVGHRGPLRVRPSLPYPEIADSDKGNNIEVLGTEVLVGHWIPEDCEARDFSESWSDNIQEFLVEETIHSAVAVSLVVNSRTVQIRLGSEPNFMMSFRFKDLLGRMECFREHRSEASSPALVFRLKYPPRLYAIQHQIDQDGVEEEITSRCLGLGNVKNESFGRCFGFMIRISLSSLRPLFSNKENLRKLKNFGLIARNIFSERDAPIISIRGVGGDRQQVERLLCRTKDRKVGMLLRSLMDNGRFCWYDALHDTVDTQDGERKNVFDLVNVAPSTLALSTLEQMNAITLPTRFPAQSFHGFAGLCSDDQSNSEDRLSTDVPDYCTTTPRLLITPTRCAVVGFSVEMSNRVVRHFILNKGFSPEHFLRVTIGEENGARMFSEKLSPSVCAYIEHLVLNGLVLNGRTYRFLAYSSSQLKEHSLWMVDPKGKWTVESIRAWMGDFSACESASKVAARMGECFSTTIATPDASNASRRMRNVKDDFPDVVSVHNGKEMCHSDGTGLIERKAMSTLIEQLPLGPSDASNVSIVQIRFGGAKGTLTAWNFSQLRSLGHPLPSGGRHGVNVCLRPSMVKFSAPYRQLEVIAFGVQIPYYLNRNVILLLKTHGVQDDIFLGMQRRMLDNLDAMLVDSTKAMEIVPRLSGPDSTLSSTLIHMLLCGMSPRQEPFLFSCLHAIRAHHLMNLRKKSRVLVEDRAVLIGSLDESGLVPEGCVFVQIQPKGSHSVFEILNGPVMVTKHPVMHPGDVRMLLAVSIPELHDHKNVILFSRHGEHPEADKMSGSDLDGDQFAITWDAQLFLGRWNRSARCGSGVWRSNDGRECLMLQADTMIQDSETLQRANTAPMDFDPESTAQHQDPFNADTIENLAASLVGLGLTPRRESEKSSNFLNDKLLLEHFINHAKNDNLGRIATMWLDYANKNGADCAECLQLAALHSIAVDFPKSGKPAVVPRELYISRNEARAHWREKKGLPSYDCNGPLGRMYDEVIRRMRDDETHENSIALAGRRYDRHGQILRFIQPGSSTHHCLEKIYKPQIAVRLGLMDLKAALDPNSAELDLLGEAMDHREAYELGVTGLMSKYGLQCEGELLTGCILKYHKLDKKRQHDVSEAVRTQCRELRRNCRRVFFLCVLCSVCPGLVEQEVASDVETAWIACVEAAAVGKAVLPHENPFSENEITSFKQVSRKLAAAYYEVTYNTEMWFEEGNRRSILFSFPWLVADVIASGIRDE